MYYFLKNKDFNLEVYDFSIDCSPRFTKKEQDVFDCFVANFNYQDEYSEFDESQLKMDENEIQKIIFSLMKKTIYCHVFKDNIEITKLYFNIFDVVVIEENKIIYKFSDEIRATKRRGNFYSRINVLAFLQFRYSYTRELFKLILRGNRRQGYMVYSLKEIKDLLKIDKEKYHRYYDLENKVFNPTMKDIEYGVVGLWFEKIKKNNVNTSRVTGVRIHFTNIYHVQVHRDTNEVLKAFSEHIEDFAQAYDVVSGYRKLYTLSETMFYVQENLDTIFKSN